jgi:hypothetical protein
MAEGFWLFEGLEETPYGLLPLVNLTSKSGATSTKQVERVGSYQWRLEEDEAVILIPGSPMQRLVSILFLINLYVSTYWPGGRLTQDNGVLVYDVNHLKV